jgi:hypothetical protein
MLRKVLPIAVMGVLLSGVVASPALAMGKVTGSKNPEGRKTDGSSEDKAQETQVSDTLSNSVVAPVNIPQIEGLGEIVQQVAHNFLNFLPQQQKPETNVVTTQLNSTQKDEVQSATEGGKAFVFKKDSTLVGILSTLLNDKRLSESTASPSKQVKLEQFAIEEVQLSLGGLKVLEGWISKYASEKLILKNTNLEDADIPTLQDLVAKIPALKLLDVSMNNFTTTGLKAIMSFFKGRGNPLSIMASPTKELSDQEVKDLTQHFEMIKKQENELGAMAVLHLGSTTFMHAQSVMIDNPNGLMIDSK